MQLYLQFGHGMMEHTRHLLGEWNDGGVILSPRDLTRDQLIRLANEATERNAEALLDPQCFLHDADHKKLNGHEFWQRFRDNSTGSFLGGTGTADLLRSLSELATEMGIARHILPGLLAITVNEDWFTFQESIINEAPQHFGDAPLLATVALSASALANEAMVEDVIDRAEAWNVSGYYVVAETPGSSYLVDDPNWLANVLVLVSGLKLHGRKVLVGYANHQMLCLASARADTMASGTWLNVRAFPREKFFEQPDSVSRRAKGGWYYCPRSLSEYKMPFLDMAYRAGILNEMRDGVVGDYGAPLFRGAQPSTVSWGESNGFRHYLHNLRSQASGASRSTFGATVKAHRDQLAGAETFLKRLQANGVFGQDREFGDEIAVNRSALTLLERARGPLLSRNW